MFTIHTLPGFTSRPLPRIGAPPFIVRRPGVRAYALVRRSRAIR